MVDGKTDTKLVREKKLTRQQQKELFLDLYSKLPIQKLVAESIGLHETTICNWKEDDKEFSNRVAKAKLDWAMDNVKLVKSKEWLLERVMKDHFAERKEVAGVSDQPLIVIEANGNTTIPMAD